MRTTSKCLFGAIMIVVFLLSAEAALAWSNNGFETGYVYGTSRNGDIPYFDETIRDPNGPAHMGDLGGAGTLHNWQDGRLQSLTFAGQGTNDARLFVLQFSGVWDNAAITEIRADGSWVKTADFQTLTGHGAYTNIYGWDVRYNPLGNSGAGSLVTALIDKSDGLSEPLTVYELDLGLNTILNTYSGPLVGTVEPTVAVDPDTGVVYAMTTPSGDATPSCLDVIAFDTSGGSTSSYTTVVDHTDAAHGGTNAYTSPLALAFRSACEGNNYIDTLLIGMGDDITNMKEFKTSDGSWVQDHAIVDSGSYNAQQDVINLDVYVSSYKKNHSGYFFLNADDTTDLGCNEDRLYDIGSPTPEPVTLALLGIGMLVIRRRRRV